MAIEIAESTSEKAARKLPAIPPLENGDQLTRAEFERRYKAMPWLKKAELVEGMVYIGSPVVNIHNCVIWCSDAVNRPCMLRGDLAHQEAAKATFDALL